MDCGTLTVAVKFSLKELLIPSSLLSALSSILLPCLKASSTEPKFTVSVSPMKESLSMSSISIA